MTSLEELDLELNYLTGLVPEELGNLMNLKELRLGGNKFALDGDAAAPDSLCKVAELSIFRVDCDLQCGCCTSCGSRSESDGTDTEIEE